MWAIPKALTWFTTLVSLALLRDTQAQLNTIGSPSVTCDPNIVGSQSSTLKVQFYTTQPFKSGGKVQIVLPQQASVVNGNKKCAIHGYIDQTGLNCQANSIDNSLTIQLSQDLPALSPIEVDFLYSFNAPLSNGPTNSFQINLIGGGGVLIATQNSGIQLASVKIAQIQAATITQVDNARVGNITQVFFSITTLNPIPPGGGVQIQIPKWNQMAPNALRDSFIVLPKDYNTTIAQSNQKRILQQVTHLCQPKIGVSNNITCQTQISDQFDLLTLIDAFPNGQPAGQTFSFYVSYLRNPISLSGVTFNLTTFSGINQINNDEIIFTGLIDQGTAKMIATDAAYMDPSICQIQADNTIVQEYSVFYVPFSVPVPVQKGCVILIQLPDDFTLDEADITMVQGWGIFGGKTELTAEIDTKTRIIKIVGQCENYSGSNILSTVKLQSIQNPRYVKQTKTFGISVLDSNNNLIASINQFITYKTTPGTITDTSLVSQNGIEIQDTSDLLLSFTPTHALKDASFFLLTLPNNIDFSCNLAYTQNLKAAPTCIKLSSNQLQFNSTFIDNSYPGNEPLEISFKNRILPPSKQDVKGIKISTYQMFNGQAYLVDEFQDLNLLFFTAQSVLFYSAQVFSSAFITYSNTTLTFSATLANDVPVGGIINISFPSDISVDTSIAQDNCVSNQGLQQLITCIFSKKDVNITDDLTGQQVTHKILVLQVTGGFKTSGLHSQEDFSITLNAGIKSPISTKTTGTFTIQVTDNKGREINYFNDALTITMTEGIDIGKLTLTSNSYISGAQSYHTISFIAPAPLHNHTQIFIQIPEEIGTPMASLFNITSAYPMAQTFENWIIGNKVTIFFAIDPSVNHAISEGTQVSFTFGPLKNPQSLAPSSPYVLHIESSDSYEVAQQTTPGIKMRNQQAATITNYSFTAFDERQGALTTITIKWENTQIYPADLSIIIKYDATQIYPQLPPSQTNTPCLFRLQKFVTCNFYDNYIKVENIIDSPEQAGQILSLTITNMRINVFTPVTTNSWKMTTYTQNGVYMIDQITGKMSFSFSCQYPCHECHPDQPTTCSDCNDLDLDYYLILYNGKCYQNCPDGTYEENFQCKLCDPKCKTCSKYSALFCTSCDPHSAYPFLDGNTCTQQCSFGFYGDYSFAYCAICTSPCISCTGDAHTCLTCDQKIPTKYFYENQCYAECPFGYVADVETRSTICEPCSPNCLNCIGRSDICSSCPQGKLLNKYQNANTCIASCPENISVANFTDSNNPTCEPCDSSCLTCKDKANFCTSCGSNFNLDSNLGVCSLNCDTKNGLQVPLNGQCVSCASSCATCQNTQDNCLTCQPGLHFYNYKCMETCPTVGGYKYEPNYENKCIIPGLYCKFGYKVSETGDFCQLYLASCPLPSKINYDKTKCIPGSDKWIPFPIWIIYVFPTFLIVIVSKLKAKETEFVSNWICFLSVAEIAAQIYVVYLAQKYGIKPVIALICFSIVIHYGINLFFLLVFTKAIKQDKAFGFWIDYNKKITTTITIFGTVINFKMYRLFFSRLFGREEFNAPMESPIVFYSPFNLSSLLNLILVKLVALFACIFGCYYISWGYQLLIECIELLGIELLLLTLSIVEYFQMRKNLLKQKEYVKIDPRRVEDHRVMGGFDEFSDELDDSQYKVDPRVRERKNKPKALKTIQQMEKILHNFEVQKLGKDLQSIVPDDGEQNERKIMKKQQRHCISFRGLNTHLPKEWESGDDEYAQNFISEPNSPRSKELLQNENFIWRMFQLHEVYKKRDQFDNVYHQAVEFQRKPMRNVKLVSVKIQTNVIELLGVDDLLLGQQSEQESQVSSQSSRYFEEIIDEKATAKMIDSVIQRIDSDGVDSDEEREEKRKRDWIEEQLQLQKIENEKNKTMKLTKKRLSEIPNFDPEEIVGEFNQDDKGYNLMIRTRFGKLNDRFGRQINRRGYLIDDKGNVITRGGVFIFYADEVNEDDEIPAPYSMNKASQMLFRVQDYVEYKKQQKQKKLAMQDDFIEKEYQRLKAESQMRDRAKTKSLCAEPNQPIGKSFKSDKSSDQVQNFSPVTTQMVKDDENISQIIQPIKPKTKKQLLGKQKSSPSISKSRQRSGESKNRKSSQNSYKNSKKSRHANSKGSTGDEFHNTGVDLSNQFIQVRSESEFNQNLSRKSYQRDSQQIFTKENQLVDLKFEGANQEKVRKNKRKGQKKRKSSPKLTRGDFNQTDQVYSENQKKLDANQNAIRQDDEFIKKMSKFNSFVNEKKLRYQNDIKNKLFKAGSAASSIQMEERSIVQQDGSVRSIGLRHQNLGQIYGRVRQNFNSQIRQGGVALRFKEPRNLLPHNNINSKVFPDNILQFDLDELVPVAQKQSVSVIQKRSNKIMDSNKLQELQQIYSHVRPDQGSSIRDRANLQNSSNFAHISEFSLHNQNKILGRFGPKSTAVITPMIYNDLPMKIEDLSLNESKIKGQDTSEVLSKQIYELKNLLEEANNSSSFDLPQSSAQIPRKKNAETHPASMNSGAYDLLHGKYI